MDDYAKASLDEIERIVNDDGPDVRSVGFALRPEQMRPNVFEYAAGDSNRKHRQTEQEELYYVMDGRFRMTVEDETFELEADDFVVVPPDSLRQLTALEDGRLFVVGAPNVKDDGRPVE